MTGTRKLKYQVGQIFRHDYQADVYEGRYQLVEFKGYDRSGRELWLVEHLTDDEHSEQRIIDDYAGGHVSLGYVDPHGPGRRRATLDETFAMELAERAAQAGQRSTYALGTTKAHADEWAEAF